MGLELGSDLGGHVQKKLRPVRREDLLPEEQAEYDRDTDTFNACQTWLREHAAGELEGFYGPDSITWQLYREPIILAGGLRAILLQIAHPAVASGVELSSNFRNDLLGRARRTFTSMYELIFGDLDSATKATRRLRRLHQRIRGHAPQPVGAPDVGMAFRAVDPMLSKWVLATLMDTAIQVYGLFIRPLSEAEKSRYILESRIAGAQFGVPPELMPTDIQSFTTYYQGVLNSGILRASKLAQSQAFDLFNSPYTRGQLDEIITTALLPPEWRDAFGLVWTPGRQRTWNAMLMGMKASLRATPVFFRSVPAWHQAQLRLALARGDRPSRYGLLVNALDRRVDLPMSLRPVATHMEEN